MRRSLHSLLLQAVQAGLACEPATTVRAVPTVTRALSNTPAASAPAAPAVKISGDVEGVLKEIDRIVSSEAVGAKEVSDAAVALAYLQAKGNRRLWGKVFEKVPTVAPAFDAPTLSSFLWAATTAGVGHFKTLGDLSGSVLRLLPSLTPAQVAAAVEGLGRVGSKDEELLAKISDLVVSNIGAYKAGDLARLVWGYAAAGSEDTKLVKAASKILTDKAGELSGKEAAQAVWGLARLRRADKSALDALVRAAKSKLDSAVDAAGLAWALGYIGYRGDADTLKTLAAFLKANAGELTAAHAVDAAWGLGVLGGDKDAASALFAVVSSAVEAAPDSLDPYQLASLYEAAAGNPGAKLPETVSAYAGKLHALVEEGSRAKRSAGLAAFKADLATAVARALGAQYRPEIAAEVASFAVVTPDGIILDIGITVDAGTKVAVEAVGGHYLSSAGTPLGPALSRAKLLESKGYKVVLVTAAEWAGLASPESKAQAVLSKLTAAAPAIKSRIGKLQYKA